MSDLDLLTLICLGLALSAAAFDHYRSQRRRKP